MSKSKKGQYADGPPTVPGEPIGDTSAPATGNGEAAPASPPETKRSKFLRLARRRIPKAEKALLQVSNLFRTAQYDCEERHLTATEEKLQEALDQCRANFTSVKPNAPVEKLFPEDS